MTASAATRQGRRKPRHPMAHQLHELGVKTCFCKPHSPWQKGGVENMNGRLRRYIPRGKTPDSSSNDDLQLLVAQINQPPPATVLDSGPLPSYSQNNCCTSNVNLPPRLRRDDN